MLNRFWQGVLLGVVLGMGLAFRYSRSGAAKVRVETGENARHISAAVQVPRRVRARLAAPVRRG
ncbi:MAG: hypothetical protein IMX00_05270 [Limnochordales bacterium]|nr:hypothetical protein [Limnochordales bacterium]